MIGAIGKLLRSTVFRISLIAAGLFIASSFIVLMYIYYATVTVPLAQIDKEIQAELDGLETIYTEQGINPLNREVSNRILQRSQNYYFLGLGEYFTSNIASPTRFDPTGDPSEVIKLERKVPQELIGFEGADVHRGRAFVRELEPGIFILVGRDVEIYLRAAERVQRALLIATLISLALGLLSGIFVSRRFARRVDSLNKLAQDIRRGDWNKRAERTESGDELDVLADHLNGMLDHINRLMSAMRYAGDSIAHDLRSPLTRLRTSLESQAAQTRDAKAKETLLDAADEASVLLQTFESILRIARLEAGDRREMLNTLNPRPIIEDVAELYGPSCEDAGLGFELMAEDVPDIQADRNLLSQAVSNLIENAIKYSEEGGNVQLRLSKIRGGLVSIAIVDDGQGIPEMERKRVKERFVRLEQSRSKPGSGLGLSFVQAVADLHRARFELSDGLPSEDEARPGLTAELIFTPSKK